MKGGKSVKKLQEIHWFLIFLAIFLFAYIPGFGWRTYEPLIIGIPFWVWYTVVITIILSVVGRLFVHFFWNDS